MAFSAEMQFGDCPWCGLREVHFRKLTPSNIDHDHATGKRQFHLLGCPRCGGPVIVETKVNQAVEVRRVPEADATKEKVDGLPPDVADYFDQARRSLEAGLPDGAAVALRKTLEAAAARHSHDSGTLIKRIEGLINDGLVTKQFGGALHHVRKIGNIGAHASDDTVTEDDARDVLDFTTQVLRNLFEVPAKLARLADGDDEGGDD